MACQSTPFTPSDARSRPPSLILFTLIGWRAGRAAAVGSSWRASGRMIIFFSETFDGDLARRATEGLDDLVSSRRAGVIVVAAGAVRMAAALVEVFRVVPFGIVVSVDGESIERVADERGMAVLLGDFRAFSGGGMVMIALVGIQVSVAVIERGDGVGSEDHVNRSGRIIANAIESDAQRVRETSRWAFRFSVSA